MHNYRGKRTKTHKKNYQVGGVIGTPEQRAEANLTAQRLAAKLQLMDPSNMQIGQYLPEYVDPSGRPAQALPTRQLPTRLPSHIRPEDVQQEQGVYYYIDPRDDNFVELDAATFRGRQFQKPIEQVKMDQAERNVALGTRNMSLGFRYGGIRQRGGMMYDQQYNEEKRQQAMQAGEARMLMAPQADLSYNPMNPQFGNQLAANTQTNIGNGNQFQNPNQPTLDNDWMTPLGIGLMGARGVLSEISGRVARKRQDNYDATQQLMFNRQGEVNLNDYQPSPYSLYARYGGKLRNYMKHGGNPAMAPYHDLPMDDYNMIMMQQQQQVPEGFHLMPDGTLMPDNQMYRGGGLSRERSYGSKKKPYPSVKASDFAGGNRSYPIPTKADAIDALRLAGLHGRADVRAKVYKKYPELKK